MSSVIRFKFQNTRDTDVICYEGAYLTLEALVSMITEKKDLGMIGSGRLLLSNAQTAEDYAAGAKIVKNSVVICRIKPLTAAERHHAARAAAASANFEG